MANTFLLPAVGDTMIEGEIVEWFVGPGDTVALDQAICSVETDKSVVEMSTPFRGTVLRLGGAPGEVIAVGSPLIIVGEPGEELAPESTPNDPAPTDPGHRRPAPTPSDPTPIGDASSKTASPIIRRLANGAGIDLGTVAGTGAGGRITRSDVEAAIAERGATVQTAPSRPTVLAMPKVRREARRQRIDLDALAGTGPHGSVTLADLAPPPTRGDVRRRLSAMRRSIAGHLTESAQTIPQFTSMVDVDMTALLQTRSALADDHDMSLPIDAFFVALLVPVLGEHRIMNAMLDGDEIVEFGRIDMGVAVDTPDGLMVPVIHGADQRSTIELAVEIRRLATAARERQIRPEELTGATCTVNNVGAVGIQAGTPILPVGTSTILAFGRSHPVVELRDGHVVSVPTMTISATFDHRIIDGGDAGRFLTKLKRHLEVPALGLL